MIIEVLRVDLSSRFFLAIHVLIFVLMADSCYSIIREDNYKALSSQGISQPSAIPIGVVLDTNSSFGSMLDLCMQIAVSDFYNDHTNYTTKLQLHTGNAETLLDANFAVIDLLEHDQVEGIIGPLQRSTQDLFVSELGQKTQVPIISPTARSSVLDVHSATESNFFVRTSVDDSIQARALANLCHEFQWPQVVLLYEDTEYGHQFQSHLSKAFRDIGIDLVRLTPIPLSADAKHLSKLLSSLDEQETKVFLVHAGISLGFRLFKVAKNVGMMKEGNAWIITDSLSNFLSSMDSSTRDSMEGAVGVRPHVAPSEDLKSFEERFEGNNSRASMYLNVYGVWAYDTIHALAIAAENTGPVPPPSYTNKNSTLRVSSYGPRLLRELRRTSFRGLSGYFKVTSGSMKLSRFEIINVIGTGERRIGYWNPQGGIERDSLKKVVWPGDSTIRPKGWAIPPTGSLRVGVPWKPGFKEFVNVEIDPATNETIVKGFAVDIFLYSLKQMPFPINYTFHCYNESTSNNWSYDNMLREIPKKYDMVVADTTLWAPRASYVDFSLPYSESGLVLVVRNKKAMDVWIFIKPLSWDLWLTILASCIIMGLVFWRLECIQPRNPAPPEPEPEPEPERRRSDQLEIAPILVPVAALAFQERGLVGRKTSFFMMLCWLFMVYVLMQSYTANLTTILILDQIQFSFSEDHYFGYHKGSFTLQFLIDTLHISPTRLIPYESLDEYHDAMKRGSKNGGIDGIFDELPYMKLLLNSYYSQYKIIGPTFKTDGLGFAFPIGSPLVAHFSRAILNVTQGAEMTALEENNFGPGYSSQDRLSDTVSQGASSLTFLDFAGLFFIVGVLNLFALLCAETDLLNKLKTKVPQLINTLRGNDTRNGENYASVGDRGNNDDPPLPPPPPPPLLAPAGEGNEMNTEIEMLGRDQHNGESGVNDEQVQDRGVDHHLP